MISGLSWYCRDEVWPRFGRIVLSANALIALLAGVALGMVPTDRAVAQLALAEVGSTGLTYSTIAFGFSLAGLTIALTLPSRKFVQALADRKNAFSDLLFVFSWTAIVHWLLVVWSVVLFAAYGTKTELLPEGPTIGRRVMVGAFGFLLVYCVCQFVTALLTLSQLGALYIRSFSAKPK